MQVARRVLHAPESRVADSLQDFRLRDHSIFTGPFAS